MKMKILTALIALAGIALLTGGIFQRSGPPAGIWYEQSENGGTLEVTKTKLIYRPKDRSFSSDTGYKVKKKGGEILLELPDEWGFIFVDLSYEKDTDRILAHTMPHTDGDGGWHLIEFKREKYVAPPPPVYPDPKDDSDPAAKKDFADLTIASMKVSFYDPGVYYDVSSNMAPEPPFAGDYSYDLAVQEDGTALVSSSFCREIRLSAEKMKELQKLIEDCEIGAINGIDIHTEGVPSDAARYEAEFVLKSGEVIRSSANWEHVPENWTRFQEPMHHLLFFAFVDAGYNFSSGAFHSTEPMKRVGWAPEDRKDPAITAEAVRITPDWPKAYDYSLDTQYPVFSGGKDHPALMNALNTLSAEYKAFAENEMKLEYEEMQAVPNRVWSREERRYCYSLYAPERVTDLGPFVSVLISEGAMNSLGIGRSSYGHYYHTYWHLDKETGELLSVSDLFVSPGALYDWLLADMRGSFGTHNDTGKFVHSDEFADQLMKWLTGTGRNGIGFSVHYDHLDLWFPTEFFTMNTSDLWQTVYYDEVQDILGDTYTAVW